VRVTLVLQVNVYSCHRLEKLEISAVYVGMYSHRESAWNVLLVTAS